MHFPFGTGYGDCGSPTEKWAPQNALNDHLQVCYFLPFNIKQLLGYLKDRLSWNEEDHTHYQEKLKSATQLRAVLRNPFVLALVVQCWETVTKRFKIRKPLGYLWKLLQALDRNKSYFAVRKNFPVWVIFFQKCLVTFAINPRNDLGPISFFCLDSLLFVVRLWQSRAQYELGIS